MTDYQARDRARSIVQRRALGGYANDTKWREFFARIHGAGVPVEIKLIDDDQVFRCGVIWSPARNYVEGEGGIGPVLFVFVEWVRSSSVEQIQAAADAVGIDCEVSNGLAIVYGYR